MSGLWAPFSTQRATIRFRLKLRIRPATVPIATLSPERASFAEMNDGDGELHIAFAIPAFWLTRWEARLEENGISIEEKLALHYVEAAECVLAGTLWILR